MHILNYQNFIDQKLICKITDEGGYTPTRHRTSSHAKPIVRQAQGQTAISLKDNFGKFTVKLPSGEELITYDDGRIDLKGCDGEVRPMLPNKTIRKNLIS